MTDRPIIFSAPMIQALLAGRKTQTRRVLKQTWSSDAQICKVGSRWDWRLGTRGGEVKVPFAIGDRLWVREAWRSMEGQDQFSGAQIGAQCLEAGYKRAWSPVQYEADGSRDNWLPDPHTFGTKPGRLRAPIHMPRWASRLTLVVTDVRVQRVRDISEDDAIAEGCRPFFDKANPEMITGPNGTHHPMMPLKGPIDAFRSLWNTLHAPDAWERNDWVAAVTFTTHQCNIDQMEKANG